MKTLVLIALLSVSNVCRGMTPGEMNLVTMVASELVTAAMNGGFTRSTFVVVETRTRESNCGYWKWICGGDDITVTYRPGASKRYPELIMASNLSDSDKKEAIAYHNSFINQR